MNKFIYIHLLLLSFLPLTAETYISETVTEQLEAYIFDYYIIPESNTTHIAVNENIYKNFLTAFNGSGEFTQAEWDQLATDVMMTFYTDIHLGSLEDSQDIQRQMIRAAMSFSTLALCSPYDYSYYLKLARQTLLDHDIFSYSSEFYLSQIFVSIYVLHLKQSLAGIRSTLNDFYQQYELLDDTSEVTEHMYEILVQLDSELPQNMK